MNSNLFPTDFTVTFNAHPQLIHWFTSLKDTHIFLTGGTGFFGCWLLESLVWLQQEFNLNLKVTVLTRNIASFSQKCPHLMNLSFIHFHQGDIRSFEFPKGQFTHMIHAATEASAQLIAEDPLLMFDVITEGTRRALDFAVHSGISRFLLTSSGAVYGQQAPELTHVSEMDRSSPDPLSPNSAYGEGKRAAEVLCAMYSKHFGLDVMIARCFAFVGPYLPLDTHFAIGNFIRDAMQGGTIQVKGDGTPFRSYMYGADLVVWLWSILAHGKSCRAYNVGSEDEVSISDLAHTVAQVVSSNLKVEIAETTQRIKPPERYVPSTQRAQKELGLKQIFDLKDSIRKTVEWSLVRQ